MKPLSLSARLFCSCFLVSVLLFLGLYFYVKGYEDSRGLAQAWHDFARAESRLQELERTAQRRIVDLPSKLLSPDTAPFARAELDAAGLSFVVLRDHRAIETGVPIGPDDAAVWATSLPPVPSLVRLSSGRYLAHPVAGSEELVLLYSLGELDAQARELQKAFLAAGVALFLLTMVLAQILAREISGPFSALRGHLRAMAESLGLELSPASGDEVDELAQSYIEFARHLQTAIQHKQLAIEELEKYKMELLRVNGNLHRRLFQLKVLLSLWNERDHALDVKDFLARFLENLLPGLPFEYGCVIIRPLAEMGAETIFAKKLPGVEPLSDPVEGEKQGTQWSDIVDPAVRDFLHHESALAMNEHAVRTGKVEGRLRADAPSSTITTLSLRLQQGDEPLGSVHFLTENPSPAVPSSLADFLLSLSLQVSAQLRIQALSFSSRLDPLTRLYNRGYLYDRLREEVVRCSRKRESFSLVMVDIDSFQGVNETHGQAAADEVLRTLAGMLKSTCRGSDAVCRFSGAVLAIVLADTPGPGAKTFAENLRRAVEVNKFSIPGGSLQVTISLGIAEFPHDGDGVDALLNQAEQALLSAKEAGRNTWRAA